MYIVLILLFKRRYKEDQSVLNASLAEVVLSLVFWCVVQTACFALVCKLNVAPEK